MPDGRVTTLKEAQDLYQKDAENLGRDYGAPSFVDHAKFGAYMSINRTISPIAMFFRFLFSVSHVIAIALGVLVSLLETGGFLIGICFIVTFIGIYKIDSWLEYGLQRRKRKQAKRDFIEKNEMWAARLNQSLRDEL